MNENKNFNFNDIIEELSSRLEDMLEDAFADQLEDAVLCAVQDALPEALNESFMDYEFILKDGTVVKPRQYTKVLSPDKSRLLPCYGGLRVDGTTLMVQTRISCWDSIAYYSTREEAIEALLKVKNAMENHLPIIEL